MFIHYQLAQSVEHDTVNLIVVVSGLKLGAIFRRCYSSSQLLGVQLRLGDLKSYLQWEYFMEVFQ